MDKSINQKVYLLKFIGRGKIRMSVSNKILSAGPKIPYPPPFSPDESIIIPRPTTSSKIIQPITPLPDTKTGGILTPIVYGPYEETTSGDINIIRPVTSSSSSSRIISQSYTKIPPKI